MLGWTARTLRGLVESKPAARGSRRDGRSMAGGLSLLGITRFQEPPKWYDPGGGAVQYRDIPRGACRH
jgi:hypothetical protein